MSNSYLSTFASHSLFMYPYLLNATFLKHEKSSSGAQCIVSLYPASKTYTALADTNYKLNTSSQNLKDSDIYPTAIRYADPASGIYVFERPPFQVEIDFNASRHSRSRSSLAHSSYLSQLKIWIPWTVFLFKVDTNSISDSYIYFNDKPLSSIEDIAIIPYTPNIFSNGRVCFGITANTFLESIQTGSIDLSVSSFCNHLFNDYFNQWNYDILPSYDTIYAAHSFFLSKKVYSRIDKKNKKTPSFIRNSSDDIYSFLVSNNSNKVWIYFLTLLSKLDFSETLEFISYLKDNASKSGTPSNFYFSTYLNNFIKTHTKTFNESKYNEFFDSNNYLNILHQIHHSSSSLALQDSLKKILPNIEFLVRGRYHLTIDNIPSDIKELDVFSSETVFSHVYSTFFAQMKEAYTSVISLISNSDLHNQGLDQIFNSSDPKDIEISNSFEQAFGTINYINSDIRFSYDQLVPNTFTGSL